MSYGIVRIQKMTSGSVRGIDIHDNRIKEFSHSNPDIDFTKSENNYKLKETNKSFYNSVQDRIKELKLPKTVRKDAVVMAQTLVTSDKNFFDGLSKEQQEDFFKKSYDFIETRYGKKNIISATVHLDEKTPHMHVNFVPVTSDGRLCAKDLLNRQEMQELQNDAFKEIFQPFGLERGESREDKRKHLTTEEFKIKTKLQESKELKKETLKLKEEKERLNSEIESLKIEALEAQERTKELRAHIYPLEGELNVLKGKLSAYKNVFEMISDIPKGKTDLLGRVSFAKEEAGKLIKSAESSFANKAKANQKALDYDNLVTKYNTDVKALPRLQSRVKELKLERDILKQKVDKIEKILEVKPDLKRVFEDAEKALDIQIQLDKQATKLKNSMDLDR